MTGLADLLAFGAASGLGSRLLDRSRRIGDGLRRLAFVRGAGVAAGAMLSGLVGVVLLVLAAPLVRGGELDGVSSPPYRSSRSRRSRPCSRSAPHSERSS